MSTRPYPGLGLMSIPPRVPIETSTLNQNIDYSNLPKPLLLQIASDLPLKDLDQLCKTSKAMNEVCQNKQFWYQRISKNFPKNQYGGNIFSWIKTYINRLQSELTEQTAERLYVQKYGYDIDFREMYITNIKKQLSDIGSYIQDYNYYNNNMSLYGRRKVFQSVEETSKKFLEAINHPDTKYSLMTPEFRVLRQRIRPIIEYMLNNYDAYVERIKNYPISMIDYQQLLDAYHEVY